jgi:hypothetical protein
MKIIRICRDISTTKNNKTTHSFEFTESKQKFVVVRPEETSNKHLEKDRIMKPVGEFDRTCMDSFFMIWCFDYQEKEAEEKLDEYIEKEFIKHKNFLETQLLRLQSIKNSFEQKEIKLVK